jgi:hypothetical protein
MKLNIQSIDMNNTDYYEVGLKKKDNPMSTPKRIDESKEKNKKADYEQQRKLKRGEVQ